MKFSRRWKGWTEKEVSEKMTDLARKRASKMSPDERKRHARMMVGARGKWIKGKYVKAER